MIQSDVFAHPPDEPPEHPDEIRAREEVMAERRAVEHIQALEAALLLYGGHSGACYGPGCSCGWYEVTRRLPRLSVQERDRRLAEEGLR